MPHSHRPMSFLRLNPKATNGVLEAKPVSGPLKRTIGVSNQPHITEYAPESTYDTLSLVELRWLVYHGFLGHSIGSPTDGASHGRWDGLGKNSDLSSKPGHWYAAFPSRIVPMTRNEVLTRHMLEPNHAWFER